MKRSRDITQPDMRDPRRAGGRQVSIMHVFREAAEHGDARAAPDPEETQRQDTRGTVDEAELRRHLAVDLESLVNTVRMDAIVPLRDGSRVARSIANYGFTDLSAVGASQASRLAVAEAIRRALIDYEPRLIGRSVTVTALKNDDAATHRLSFEVQADIIADPADLPLDFVAEVDLGSGKMKMRNLKLQR